MFEEECFEINPELKALVDEYATYELVRDAECERWQTEKAMLAAQELRVACQQSRYYAQLNHLKNVRDRMVLKGHPTFEVYDPLGSERKLDREREKQAKIKENHSVKAAIAAWKKHAGRRA
jgi:hypothetical protein